MSINKAEQLRKKQLYTENSPISSHSLVYVNNSAKSTNIKAKIFLYLG